ncbi:NHL repeat-containing protein [candidate division KSB1 bacterium]
MLRNTITLLILFFSMSKISFTYGQEIKVIDGVRYVQNKDFRTIKKPVDINIDLVKTIGKIDTNDDNYLFYMPSDIVVGESGEIYVLDSGNHRIQKYGSNGEYIRTIGNEGQGPAEYKYPFSLDINTNEELYIADQGNSRIQVIGRDGRNRKTVHITDGLGSIRILNSGNWLLGGGGGLAGMVSGSFSNDIKLMRLLDEEGNYKHNFCDRFDYNNLMMNRMGNEVFFTINENDNIYIVFAYQNRIEKYSPGGKLLMQISRELNYDLTRPEPESQKAEGRMVSMKEPDMNRCSAGIAVDNKNRIWVITLNRQIKDEEIVKTGMSIRRSAGGTRDISISVSGNTDIRRTDIFSIEIYDESGILSGKIPLDHFADGIRIFSDKVYILDSFRSMQIYEYRINNQ